MLKIKCDINQHSFEYLCYGSMAIRNMFTLISISPQKHTKSLLMRTCVCKALQQLFIKYLIKQLNTFSICKYGKTVNCWSPNALVDGSLESRTPC